VTQQNASLVEEAAAAAESMREQAAALVQTVSVFKVSRQEGATRTASHASAWFEQPVRNGMALAYETAEVA
jgi:methyl-accepting chemotaxis protein